MCATHSIQTPVALARYSEIFSEGEKPGFEVHASLGLAAESILLRQRGRSRRFELELCDNICVACELRSKHRDECAGTVSGRGRHLEAFLFLNSQDAARSITDLEIQRGMMLLSSLVGLGKRFFLLRISECSNDRSCTISNMKIIIDCIRARFDPRCSGFRALHRFCSFDGSLASVPLG